MMKLKIKIKMNLRNQTELTIKTYDRDNLVGNKSIKSKID
jgi:hypothetical protein